MNIAGSPSRCRPSFWSAAPRAYSGAAYGKRLAQSALTLVFVLTVLVAERSWAQEFRFGDVRRLSDNVNDYGAGDGGPSVSSDGLALYFASNRADGAGGWDLYVATRSDPEHAFGQAASIDSVNGAGDDLAPSAADDGLTLYFASNRPEGAGETDLYVATRLAPQEPFAELVQLAAINSPARDDSPCLSEDGLSLYFASNREGGQGNFDLYVATRRGTTEPFGNVTNLAGINTLADEYGPSISKDGLTLFWGELVPLTDPETLHLRAGGNGGPDLWMASRSDVSAGFGKVRNVGLPVSIGSWESAASISVDWPQPGSTLYFMNWPFCKRQIYQATWAPGEPVAPVWEARTFENLPYQLFVPEGYDPAESYPLVLFLHGAGQNGRDNPEPFVAGATVWTEPEYQKIAPAFVVAPQAVGGWSSGPFPTVLRLLDALEREFPIDRRREYVTGRSSGANGTWEVLGVDPFRFAAAAPVSGGSRPHVAARIVHVPAWIFHGAVDNTVGVGGARTMVSTLERHGGSPRYTEYPGLGHSICELVYFDPELRDWMFSHVLPFPLPALSIRVVGDGVPLDVEVDASASTAEDDHAIVSYEWDFGDGSSPSVQSATATSKHTYTTVGLYTIVLTVTDDRGLQNTTNEIVSVSPSTGDVTPWHTATVGTASFPGGASGEVECLRVIGASGNMSGRSDEFHFTYQEMADDFELRARLTNWSAETSSSKLGLMVREALDPDARTALVALDRRTNGFRHRFLRREAVGGILKSSSHETYPESEAWLRLRRRGNVVTGSLSTDGVNWSEPDTIELPELPRTVFAGVASSWTVPTAGGPAPSATMCDLTLAPLEIEPQVSFLRGDCDGDSSACSGVSDALELLSWLFLGRTAPPCLAACDPDGNGELDLADAVYGLNFCFNGAGAPVAPFPECGPGVRTDTPLACETSNCP